MLLRNLEHAQGEVCGRIRHQCLKQLEIELVRFVARKCGQDITVYIYIYTHKFTYMKYIRYVFKLSFAVVNAFVYESE